MRREQITAGFEEGARLGPIEKEGVSIAGVPHALDYLLELARSGGWRGTTGAIGHCRKKGMSNRCESAAGRGSGARTFKA